MAQQERYKGTINKLNGGGDYGYIKRGTITRKDGSPANLTSKKDVYIHSDDCNVRLHLGMQVTFTIVADQTRPDAFRAAKVREASEFPVEGAVEIHFDEPTIDHPSVPFRWCIKPEVLAYMRSNIDSQWALVIVAQKQRNEDLSYRWWDRSKTVIQAVNGAERIGDGRGYFSFRSPGDYDFVTYLVKSSEGRSFWSRLKEAVDKPGEINVWDSDGDEIRTAHRDLDFISGSSRVIAYDHMKVSVPAEVFAKPLPDWVKDWLGYFQLNRPRDECSMRGRIAFAFTFGVALYLLFEIVKRTWILFAGILHFLFGGNPLSVWKEAVASRLSARLGENLLLSDEHEHMMDYKGWKFLLVPIFPVTAITLAATWFLNPDLHIWYLRALFAVVAIVIAVLLFGGVGKAMRLYERHTSQQKQAAVLVRIETYAMCGGDIPPKAPTNVRLLWSGVKRAVCRTYG